MEARLPLIRDAPAFGYSDLARGEPEHIGSSLCATSTDVYGYRRFCGACEGDPQAEPAGAKLMSALDALAHSDERVSLDPSLLAHLSQRLDEFLRWRLDRPLKTLTT